VAHSVDRINGKLRRAEEHVGALKRMSRDYMHEEINRVRAKVRHEGENGVGVHFVVPPYRPQPVIDMAVVVGDVIHNLRSGLDHLAWELVRSVEGVPTKYTYFPILETGPTPDRHGRRPPPHIAGGVDPAALEIIESVQPYIRRPANPKADVLAGLHRLSLEDKHHGLVLGVPHALVIKNTVAFEPWHPGVVYTGTLRVVNVFDGGAQATFIADQADVEMERAFTFEVCLEQGTAGLPRPVPVIPVLTDMISRTRDEVFLPLAEFLIDCWEPRHGGPLRP